MKRIALFLIVCFIGVSEIYSQEYVSDTLIISVGANCFDTVVIKNRAVGEKIFIRSKYTDHDICIDKPVPYNSIVSLAELDAATAPPKSWKFDFEGGLTCSQLFVSNWAAGGETSIAGRVYFNTGGRFQKKRTLLNYRVRCALGYQWRPELDKEDKRLRKTDDRLEIDVNYGYRIKSNFYYSAFMNFRSQFANGYNDNYTKLVSKFMAPGYLTYGIGIEYSLRNSFGINLSPLTIRHTFVIDSLIASLNNYGMKNDGRVKTDLGANLSIYFNQEVLRNTSISTKLTLFSDYLNNPQNIDITFEAGLNFKLNKFFSTGIYFNYLYDDNVLFNIDGRQVPRSQFKESFWIGLVYKM